MSNKEKQLVQKLKNGNKKEIYDALVKIRKNYVKKCHKMKRLQKYSVIELIIPFLKHPKFCNETLSIIADGCLELDFVKGIIKRDGINSLIRKVKSPVTNDIRNEACRALGNIAKFQIGFKALHHMKTIPIIIDFLSERSNDNCQETAVRTLMILSKGSKAREIITQKNGILCISKLLRSSNVQLLICSIEAIAKFTRNCSLLCARQLLDPQFFKVLVELYSHTEKSIRKHALISLRNLSSQEEVRSDLIKVGAVKLFTEVLSCESYEMGRVAALALCSCLDHIHMWSQNGTDIAVGLKALLVVLENQRYQDIHLRVIASLIPLAYESKVSGILLNLGVLQVLIKLLELFIEKHKCKSMVKFLDKSYSPYLFSPDFDFFKYYRPSKSGTMSWLSLPGKKLNSNVACWSPVVSTHSKSLLSRTFGKIDDFEEITEVSIDADFLSSTSKCDQMMKVPKSTQKSNDEVSILDTEFQSPKKKLKTEIINEVGPSEHQYENSSGLNIPVTDISDSPDCKQLSVSMQETDHYILNLIWQISFHLGTKTNTQIADKFCYSVLISYVCFIHNPCSKAKEVLFNLMKNRYCFQKLIINGFVSELEENVPKSYSGVHHSRISTIGKTYNDLINIGRQEAESDYGIGFLSHILATSKKSEKLNAICAMSKFVTKRSKLFKILIQAKGLSVLLSLLSDNNVTIRKKIIVSLCELYQSLTKGQKSEKGFVETCRTKTSSKCSYKESFLNVTFSVDSGTKILANQEKLCEKSDYFRALLSGFFLETKAKVVPLSGMSAENLSIIFHFMHGCGNCCPYIKRIEFLVLLELLSDCDMLLLLDIKAIIEHRLSKHLILYNGPKIYRQAKIHNAPALARKSLEFVLNFNTYRTDILCNSFEELINLEPNINVLKDIENLIKNLF